MNKCFPMHRVAISVAVVLLLLFSCVGHGAPQHPTEYHVINVPGALESALSLNPQSAVRHELGSLTPPGSVALFAVVAFAPFSREPIKGLEARVEGDDIWNNNRHCRGTAYIDEEGLHEFEERLTGLAGSEKVRPHSSLHSVVMAGNKSGAEPQEDVLYVPLVVGSYWTGDRFGVYIYTPPTRLARGWGGSCQFNMPNADVSEFLVLVQEGHRWLEENSH